MTTLANSVFFLLGFWITFAPALKVLLGQAFSMWCVVVLMPVYIVALLQRSKCHLPLPLF